MAIRNKESIFQIIILLFAFLFCEQVFAEAFETSEHLHQITQNFVENNITTTPEEALKVTVSPTLNTLRLTACTQDIEAAFPANTNKTQATGVELTCNGVQPWHVLVPVEVQVNTSVIVAKQTIMPKDPITEENIEYATYDRNHLYNSYFKNKEEVLGQVASHLITPGTILTQKNLQNPVLIHRNQVISLIVRSGSIAVTMRGIARSDGSINATIQAYNPVSRREMQAIVVGPDKAEIIA